MEGEGGFTPSIIDELHSLDIGGDQIKGESCVTQSIIDEFHSWDIEGDQMERNVDLFEVSLMNFILCISNEIKWKTKVVLLEE